MKTGMIGKSKKSGLSISIILLFIFFIITFSCEDNELTITTIYTAGYESNGTNTVAKYWEDGTETVLSDGTESAQVNSIFVVDSDIYVAGYELNGANGVAKYWKNGVETSLTDGTNDANAYSIYVSDSDVYVAGYEGGGSLVAKYWKNGVETSLTDGTQSARVNSIFIGIEYY